MQWTAGRAFYKPAERLIVRMIRKSFIILERVGRRLEENLWSQGIHTWKDFLERERISGISARVKPYHDRKILEAQKALYTFDSRYFKDKLADTWRLYRFFHDDAVFLDIETSGLGHQSYVTVVGLYDGLSTKSMIRGINLDPAALKEELSRYKVIITFNGALFDLPFLNRRYPGVIPEIPHIDLRPVCAKVGLSGGLKSIERQLGIKRRQLVENLSGGDALLLWRRYLATGDDHYLNLLVEYNEEDCINLRTLADHAIGKLEAEHSERYSKAFR
jgi:uncharacterized protein